jgi:hypothetical protein
MKKMIEWCIFIPAYDRVYETADEVLLAFHSNKVDFRCIVNGFEAYSTKREMLELSDCRGFEIRYGKRHEKVTTHVELERG